MNANIIMCGVEPNKTDFLENVSYWSNGIYLWELHHYR